MGNKRDAGETNTALGACIATYPLLLQPPPSASSNNEFISFLVGVTFFLNYLSRSLKHTHALLLQLSHTHTVFGYVCLCVCVYLIYYF